MNKRKYILTLIAILVVVTVLVAGGTYAYWTWNSDVTKNVVFNTSKGISEYIVYDEGDSFFIGDFQPQSSFCQGASTTLSFYKTSEVADVTLAATINMDVNHIDSVVASSSAVHWILTKGDNTILCSDGLNSTDVVASGTFFGVTSGNTITLKSHIEITTVEQKFTVWIWIDSTGSNLSNLSGKTIDTNIWTQIDMLDTSINTEPEAPVLDEGIIPVKIANDGTVTTAPSVNSWYNYDNKEWANAVLVKASGTKTRSYYMNTSNVTIPESDILAYYVWIPRYKYQIWSNNGAIGTTPVRQINIEFESNEKPISSGTTIGSWRTHPAFIWDGSPVSGIWVGKFETSHSTLSSSTTLDNLSCNSSTCGNANGIIIKPNVASLRYNSVSNQFYASISMVMSGSSAFGLNKSYSDSHMMKNSEWGAVAYLSHSQYGINSEIRINNNSSYITGCGASTENGSSTSSCEITYGGATSYPQSTTGNITGVFDMSGGAMEYVMGNYNNTIMDSGFSAMPPSKYYDLYLSSQFTGNSSTNINMCTIETCGGHALFETQSWYSDGKTFVNPNRPWFMRGGVYSNNSTAGVWYLNAHIGNAVSSIGFRSSIIVKR